MCLSADCDTRPRLAGAVSGPCRPPTSIAPARATEAPTRLATKHPTRARPRNPATATQRHPQRRLRLLSSHEKHVRPRSPTTDDANPHLTAGIAAAPHATNDAPLLSTTVTARSEPYRRRRRPQQQLSFVLPLHRYVTVHHCATISSSARRRMCSAHVSPLPQLDAADHLRLHCHTPPLALPLQFAHAKVPAATFPHATAGTAQRTRTHRHSPPLHRVGVAHAPYTGLASLGSLRTHRNAAARALPSPPCST